jgi:hypothetical protein
MFDKLFITVDGKGSKKLRKQMKKFSKLLQEHIALSHESHATIHTKLDAIMTKQEILDGLIQRLMGSSAGIAADLRTLATQINEGTVTPESLQRLAQIAETFEQLDAQNTQEGSGTGEPGEGDGTENGAGTQDGTVTV